MQIFTKFLFIFIFLTGCSLTQVTGPIITGITLWSQGEATKYYNVKSESLHRVLKSCLVNLDINIKKDLVNSSGYNIVAGEKNRFKINIRDVENGISKVSIRINFMGDKPYADLIYKKIDENLDVIEFKDGYPLK